MIAFIRRKNFIRLEFLCARQLERAGSVCAPVDKFLQTIYFTASLSFTFSLPQQLSWLQWQGSPFPSVIETKSGIAKMVIFRRPTHVPPCCTGSRAGAGVPQVAAKSVTGITSGVDCVPASSDTLHSPSSPTPKAVRAVKGYKYTRARAKRTSERT